MKKQNAALTISSLLSLVFTTFHLTHDNLHVAQGVDVQGTVILLVIMLVMAYGTVELAGTRLGYLIMFLGGIAAATMPFLHTLGPRAIRWGFFFVWTLYVLGLTGTFSAVVAARELWRSFRNPSP